MSGTDAPEPQPVDELARLRAENARLQAELSATRTGAGDGAGPTAGRGTSWWRPVVVGVLFFAVGVLAPLSIVATWVHDEVSDTDRYVETVAPLASDPAVQNAVVRRATDLIFSRLDVEAFTEEAVDALEQQGLPPRAANTLSALSGPIANGIRGFVQTQVGNLVRSDVFQEAWVAANREAHTQLVAVLTGDTEGNVVQVQGPTVSVNLAAVISTVKQRLEARGFELASRIPDVNAQFTIMRSADIERAQNGFRVLDALARGLPIVALILFGAAIAVAGSRRRALVVGSLVVAGSMLLLGAMLNGFRIVYLDALPASSSQPAAEAIYDQLASFIRLNLRAVLVLFLAVAVVAWVSGPSTGAVTVRSSSRNGLDALRTRRDRAGLGTGAFGVALHNLRTPIRLGVAGVVVLAYVLADHPTGAFTLGLLAVAAAVLLLVELLARAPEPEGPGPLEPLEPATIAGVETRMSN